MKKNLLLTFLLLLCSQISWAEITKKYVLLLRHSQQTLTGDEAAVLSWFNSAHSSDGTVVYANYLGNSGYTLNKDLTKVVWVHLDGTYTNVLATAQGYINNNNGTTDATGDAIPEAARTALKNYVLAGGNLYLSKYATQLVKTIGRTSFGPNLLNERNNDDKKGINPEIGKKHYVFDHHNHPIFKDLISNTRTDGDASHIYYDLAASTYSGTGLKWDFADIKENAADPYRIVDFEIMHNAIVLGAWEHVVDYACAGLIEFLPIVNNTNNDDHFQGRIIANGMGGYDWNNPHENNNIQQLTINILTYLGTEKTHKVAYVLPNDGNETVDPDDEATALQWFEDEIVNKGKGTVIHPSALADLDPTEYTTIWIHIDRDLSAATGDWGDIDNKGYKPLLTRYVKNGGNLLLTKHAVQLVRADKGINRCDDNHLSLEYGVAEGDHVGIKDNEDPWVINPVIGAGWTGSGYVRYTEAAANNEVSSVPVGDKFDNKDNALYFNLKSEINHPIGVTGADTKYLVYHICGRGVKEDHNNLWKFGDDTDDHISSFQTTYNCTVLGQWGHKSQLNNAAIVQFEETGKWYENAWEGKILCIGLGAYEWQPSNADGTPRSGENPYLNNIKQLTYNALNLLDDTGTQDVHYELTYGGVTYELHTIGLLHYAKIKSADADLQVYDLTQQNGLINNGAISVEAAAGQTYYINGVKQSGTRDFEAATYNITNIADGAFQNCTNLAYADLMAFQGVVPSTIRNCFHAHTLIYLPREEVWNIDKTAAYGTNIINTMWNSSAKTEVVKVCNNLQVWDNTSGTDNTTGWVYYWWANKYPFTAKAVSFTRSFRANEKSTVALPFAISSDELSSFGAFYRFDRIVDDDKAKFYPVYATEAYKPYMIVPKGGNISISAEKYIATLDGNPTFSDGRYSLSNPCSVGYFTDNDVTANSRGANFIAEYREQTFDNAESQGIYAYRNGTYQTTSGTIYADPYRGYVKLTNPSGARVLQIVFEDDEVTGIANIEDIDADKGCYYTLSGVKVANPTRGIYLKNGKKVIVK